MRVMLLGRGAGPDGTFEPGTRVIEVDEETALRMVVDHQAVYTLRPVTDREKGVSHDDKD